MSTEVEQTLAPSLASGTVSFLEQAIDATKQTEPSRAEELLKTLTEEALKGTVTWNKNLTVTFKEAISALDSKISEQLREIMRNQSFQKLEGSWRGLNYLVTNSETSATLKIRMVNITKKELHKDLSKAAEFDQSQVFKKIYESEFGSAGGEPYGALIGDYEFTNHPEDIETLRLMSGVSAAGFAPFLSAASPELFGFGDWSELARPRDLEKVFESLEYTQWRSFRESEDSRFVCLTMPKVMARLPYGQESNPIEEFGFEECEIDPNTGLAVNTEHDDYCWMNSSFVLGTKLTNAFANTGFCTAIRGAEGGGKVESLPTHYFLSEEGDPDMKCPTEVGITDRREAELSHLGFLPLCHYKNTDYAVFFGSQTCQKPQKYNSPDATANAAISSRLPYLMATSRFAHYLKIMARDKVGSFAEADDMQDWLNSWILSYVNSAESGSQDIRAKYPLADARVEVKEIPGNPGAYNAVAWLKPWLQLEELTTSVRLVAKIPQGS